MIANIDLTELSAVILSVIVSIGGGLKLCMRWIAAYVERQETAHAQELAAARIERQESRRDFLGALDKITSSLDQLAQQREKDRTQLDSVHEKILRAAGLNGGSGASAIEPKGVTQ